MGADGFISKPFSSEELLNKIRSIIGLWGKLMYNMLSFQLY
jgi:DNA-binding response OmpR family regulator